MSSGLRSIQLFSFPNACTKEINEFDEKDMEKIEVINKAGQELLR